MNEHAEDPKDDANQHSGVNQRRRGIIIAGATAPVWLPELVSSTSAEPVSPAPSSKPGDDLVMTIVYDNNAGPETLLAKWGFGCLIKGAEKTILFDTGGEGWALMANLHQLEFDPNEIDVVVLSHIHWDHVGGLGALAAERKGGLPVYVPSGFPQALLDHIRAVGNNPIEAADSKQICHGVRTTGTLGQGAIEEHGLCVRTRDGWTMITGCAHPGVHKMAAQADKVTGGPIQTVFGGFHMLQKPNSFIDGVVKRFETLGVGITAPTHCTGDPARNRFKEKLGDRCVLPGVGHVFTFPAPAPNRQG